jgi:hypothetical protein
MSLKRRRVEQATIGDAPTYCAEVIVKRELVSCVLVASLLLSIGCSSSYVVSSPPNADPSFDTFNVDARDRSGAIVFQDGRKVGARNIMAAPDSIRFLNEKTNAITVVPTYTVKKVVFKKHAVGALYGVGIGALVGAAIILVMASGPNEDKSVVADYTLAGAAGAGAIGGVFGLAIGHSYEYQFVTEANSTTIK